MPKKGVSTVHSIKLTLHNGNKAEELVESRRWQASGKHANLESWEPKKERRLACRLSNERIDKSFYKSGSVILFEENTLVSEYRDASTKAHSQYCFPWNEKQRLAPAGADAGACCCTGEALT
jgi:hypothetical protein